jgi:hypothetical protein
MAGNIYSGSNCNVVCLAALGSKESKSVVMKMNYSAPDRRSMTKPLKQGKPGTQKKRNFLRFNIKVVARILAIFIITYTLQLLPQTGMDRKYAEFYCSFGNKLFKHFGNEGYVELNTQEGKNNISLFISKYSTLDNGKLKGQYFNISSNMLAYYYVAFLISLILATPLTWKRKIFAFTVGLIIITVFVMLKLWVNIYFYFASTAWIGLYQDAGTKESINFWHQYFAGPMTLGYSVVVIVWLGLCIGKKEWKKLNGVLMEITANKKNGKANKKKTDHYTSKKGI